MRELPEDYGEQAVHFLADSVHHLIGLRHVDQVAESGRSKADNKQLHLLKNDSKIQLSLSKHAEHDYGAGHDAFFEA
ncbi:hypothetical protein D3C73_1492300 [compost metagenome]